MRSWVLLLICISAVAHAQKCDLNGRKDDVDFPDIEAGSAESYELTVEYTLPNAGQTDFYTEYYDTLNRRGRIDMEILGKSSTYMYETESWEAWQISDATGCNLINVTETPKMFKEDQSDWLQILDGDNNRTVGPSAMFKIASAVWKSGTRSDRMAYMGFHPELIRGLRARYWRRCKDDGSFVEYYFSADKVGSAFSIDILKTVPLRVIFGGSRTGEDPDLNDQVYDIMTFHPAIPSGMTPFDLPKGKNCKRGPLADTPDLPTFDGKSVQFEAEVIYRKIDSSGQGTQYWSYFSTLTFAMEQRTQHYAYHYTPWKSSKKGEEPTAGSLIHLVYDMKHHYAYKTNISTGQCELIRDKSYYPNYDLPDERGSISLTDPAILYPNNELEYLSEGTNRGLRVYVYEYMAKNFELDLKDGSKVGIPNTTITHSYLQDNQRVVTTVSVKNPLTQVQIRMVGREKGITEVLTFNFFKFSTQVTNRRTLFNIKRCFRNNDDYVWATIGFNIDSNLIPKVKADVPSIQSNILNALTMKSELNPVRIPIILVDFSDTLYVSMQILGKPPVLLDYQEPVEGMGILDAAEEEGDSDVESCAKFCLEETEDCWGFSICGAVCSYGSVLAAKPGPKKGCKLYNRFDNKTFLYSIDKLISDLRTQVKDEQVKLLVLADDDSPVQVTASSIEISDPGEDDRLFNRLGNKLDSRLRVRKVGAKLKAGTEVTDMGAVRYDECQKLCLDYKDCESASYCLTGSKCVYTNKYGDDLQDGDIEDDNMCNLFTRKYADHFQRTPGVVLSLTAQEIVKDADSSEKCAKACLKKTNFNCLSFDHCPTDTEAPCKLHTVHYPNPNTRESVQEKSTSCGHYYRKFSTEFKANPQRRTAGSTLPAVTNLTLEDCSRDCIEYGGGVCFGFDFCQGSTMLSTSCTLLDKEMKSYKIVENKMCTNYIRAETLASPLPYSNSYAGGIGFLCFLIGGIVGVAIVFGIAYFRVNRR